MSETRQTRPNRLHRDGSTRIASPLDPFLRDFLAAVDRLPNGLNPTRGLKQIADECDWEQAFVEVLFTAARTRGLVGPHYPTKARGKLTWVVSARGRHWLGSPSHDPRESTVVGDVH